MEAASKVSDAGSNRTSEVTDFEKLYTQEQKKVAVLEQRLSMYEQDGPAKLYYSLNRKSWEMADLLNKTELHKVDMDTKDSKTFDRLRTIWTDAEKISTALAELKILANISGDEKKDIERKPFIEGVAKKRD